MSFELDEGPGMIRRWRLQGKVAERLAAFKPDSIHVVIPGDRVRGRHQAGLVDGAARLFQDALAASGLDF